MSLDREQGRVTVASGDLEFQRSFQLPQGIRLQEALLLDGTPPPSPGPLRLSGPTSSLPPTGSPRPWKSGWSMPGAARSPWSRAPSAARPASCGFRRERSSEAVPQTKKDIHEGVGGGSIGIRQGSGRGKKSYPRRTTKGMINALMKGVNHDPGFCLARERGRPARMLSLWLPLSFSAMPQAATLWAGTHRPGRRRAMAPFPVDPSGGDGRGCARHCAGGTPALPGSHHCAGGTPALPGRELVHAQEHKIADAFGYRLSFKQVHLSSGLFVSIRVYLCPLVVRLHERSAVFPRMIRTAGREQPCPGARASRPHAVPLAAAELRCNATGSHPAGGNRIGRAEGEPWRRSRLIQVGEMAEAVPGLVRAGRPRSREAIIVRAGRPRSREAIIVRAGRPRSREAVIMRAGRPRSRGDPFWAPLVVEAGPSVFVSIRVYLCPLVVRLHERSAVFPRMIRTAGREQPCLGARASRPHAVPLAAAELRCNAAGSHPVGGNRIGQAEGEPWRRCRLIQVEEMAEAVPGLVRAGRPRSQEENWCTRKGRKLQTHFGAPGG